MKSGDQKKIVHYYNELFNKYGYSPKSLGWDKGNQFLRFHQLTSDWSLNGKTFLDVGCGFGDFVDYLHHLEVSNFSYVGSDLVKAFVNEARARHGTSNVKFFQQDFLNADFTQVVDYSIASGVFNLTLQDHDEYEHLFKNMEKMFSLSSKAISIDFLSDKVDYSHTHNFNFSPEKILSMAYNFSRNVVLKNTYFPFEFSVTIYKDDGYMRDNPVFNQTQNSLAWLR